MSWTRRSCFVILVYALLALPAADLQAQPRDEFYWLGEINRASAVMLREQGIVPATTSRQIA